MPPGSIVFCDFDGPIADVSERYYSTYRQALTATCNAYQSPERRLPIRWLTKAQFWHMKQTRVPDPVIADWSGLEGAQVVYFLDQVAQLVNQTHLLHQDCLQPGAREALLWFQAQGVRLVIVTLRHTAQVLQFLHDHDVATTVSQIYGATDLTTAYPNRIEHKIVSLKAAISDQRRLGFSTHAAWMIGDTEADIQAGQTAGLPTLGLTCGIRSQSCLAAHEPTIIAGNLHRAAELLLARSANPSTEVSQVSALDL
ncbi:MAG: HAD family hydrolase [Cyanobacteria bacterium]|nr:HAD family hydrolase [Cyanobacteriota bacterium]MDA0864964.1 HAD family hydrolase [Cyanobacteriota bacterium]